MLTGSTNGETATKLLKAGALDYLTKNYLDDESLRRAVQGSVDRFRLMEEHRRLQARNAQVQASTDAILGVDLDLVVRTWNPGATAMLYRS
jgi:FixJ family two-component response regulator